MAITFEQPFFSDPSECRWAVVVVFVFVTDAMATQDNRHELVYRLHTKGFTVAQKGSTFTVSAAGAQSRGESVPSVSIADIKPGEFQMAHPNKKLQGLVVMGRHSSVSQPKSPVVVGVPGKDKEEVSPRDVAHAAAPAQAAPAPAIVVASAAPPAKSDAAPPAAVTVPRLNVPLSQSSQVEMSDFLKLDPIKVREQYHPRSDAVSVRARANAKLTPSEIKGIQNGSTKCHVCEHSFDLFRAPDKCSECSKMVCTHCSSSLPYLEALIGQTSCVCVDCWTTVRVKLEVKLADSETLSNDKALCKGELTSGDKLMNMEADDRANPAEKMLLAEATKAAKKGASAEEIRNAALAAGKKLECPCCDRHMDLFRRPAVCGKCRKIVCAGAACVRVVNEVLEGSPFACCRGCWKEVRVALIDKQKHKPETFNAIEVDLAVGDRFFIIAEPGKPLHLENAFEEAILQAERSINERRKAEHNPKISVSKSPRVNLDLSKMRKTEAGEAVAMPKMSPRSDAISPRAVAASKFSQDEAKEMGSKKVVCRRCQLPFSLFRAPDRCGECNYSVCSKCSYTLPHLPELLGQDGTTCNVCWDMVRTKLFARGKALPKLAERCDKEVGLGDKVLFHAERTTQAERVLRARAKEDMEKNPPVFKRTEEEHLERYVKKLHCEVCTRNFDLFRRPTICTRCHALACAGASCVRFVAHGNEHVCCRNCWPEMRGELERTSQTIKDASEYETIAMDMAFGDKFLHDLHFKDVVNLQEATSQAIHVAQALIAKHRLDNHEALQNSDYVPANLHNSIEANLLATNAPHLDGSISPRPAALEKFNPRDRDLCEKGKLKCARCKGRFDCFKAPERCTECKEAVCTKCSFNFPHLHQLLPQLDDNCVCSTCWEDGIRATVKAVGTEKALAEVALGDEVLYTEPEDRHVPAEAVLENMHKERRSVVPVDEFAKSLSCPKCTKHYSMWNKPTVCSQCKLLVCTGLGCAKLVTLLPEHPICCRDCWPNVRRELLQKVHDKPELADEVDMERAIGDKIFLELKPGAKVDMRRVVLDAEKEGRNAIAQRQMRLSVTNLPIVAPKSKEEK